MKGLNAKRIAALAAGAALLGSAFAFANVSYLNKDIINQNGQPVVKVVVGGNAAASDGVAAANIAATIGNMAYRSQTVTAQVQGQATCSISAGSGAGACPVSNEKVTLEVGLPGVVSGAYGFRTFISDWIDRDLENRRENTSSDMYQGSTAQTAAPFTNKAAKRITGSDFAPLATFSPRDPFAGNSYTEEQRVWLQGKTMFDDTLNAIVGASPNSAYEFEFTHDSYGVTVCTTRDTSIGSDGLRGDWTDCQSPTDATDRHRVGIKFLGEDWIISSMTPPSDTCDSANTDYNGGSLKLARESAYGIVHIGEALNTTGGSYMVKLVDITVPVGATNDAKASVEIRDANNVLLKEDQIAEGDTYTYTAPDGTKLRIRVYKTNPGYTLAAKWAEMAVYSREIELIDGEQVDDNNPNWEVAVYWRNKDYSSTMNSTQCDALRRVVVMDENNNQLVKLQKGSSYDIITEPTVFQLSYDGLTLAAGDYDTVSFTVQKLTSPLRVTNATSGTPDCDAYYNVSGPVLYVSSSAKDYFTIGSGDQYNAKTFYVKYPVDGQTGNPDDQVFRYPFVMYKPTGAQCWYMIDADARSDVTYDPGDEQQDMVFSMNALANASPTFGYVNITEAAGEDGADEEDNIWFRLNLTASSNSDYEFLPDDKAYYLGVLTSDADDRPYSEQDELYITERGSIFSSIDKDQVSMKIAKKVAEAQYYLKTSGTSSASASQVGPLGEGETASLAGGAWVKVLSITETVGACTAAGSTCTVDQAGVSAVLSTGGASLTAVTPYHIDTPLVVLDSSNPTGPLVSVGGPEVNMVTKTALQGASITWAPGTKVKQAVGDVIVIAGYTAAETQEAANELINELKAQRV